MPKKKLNRATGLINDYAPHMRNYDYELVCGAPSGGYPAEYEIPRENTGTLKDQGMIGACVAEVLAQASEGIFGKEMSEGYIYGEFRSDSMKKGQRGGMSTSQAMDYWRKLGTVPKSYFDILEEMPEMPKITAKFPELKEIGEQYRIVGYTVINYNKQKKEAAIKDALMKYNLGLVAVSPEYFGGSHCILLTGWNDKKDTWKFKNSWGENYGDKGFSEIPRSEVRECYLPLFEEVKMPFKDVTKDKWYYDDVKAVYASGLMNGTSETTFDPEKPLTRAEMAAILNRTTKMTDERFDIFNRLINEKID